jgi:uncharacterized membrane protein YidH (DUF202 family)
MKSSTRNRIGRIFLIVFSLLLIFIGAVHIMSGSMGWRNYWGGLVFAPFAIFFGLLLIYLAIFRWRKLQETPGDRKGRVPDTFKNDWRKW